MASSSLPAPTEEGALGWNFLFSEGSGGPRRRRSQVFQAGCHSLRPWAGSGLSRSGLAGHWWRALRDSSRPTPGAQARRSRHTRPRPRPGPSPRPSPWAWPPASAGPEHGAGAGCRRTAAAGSGPPPAAAPSASATRWTCTAPRPTAPPPPCRPPCALRASSRRGRRRCALAARGLHRPAGAPACCWTPAPAPRPPRHPRRPRVGSWARTQSRAGSPRPARAGSPQPAPGRPGTAAHQHDVPGGEPPGAGGRGRGRGRGGAGAGPRGQLRLPAGRLALEQPALAGAARRRQAQRPEPRRGLSALRKSFSFRLRRVGIRRAESGCCPARAPAATATPAPWAPSPAAATCCWAPRPRAAPEAGRPRTAAGLWRLLTSRFRRREPASAPAPSEPLWSRRAAAAPNSWARRAVEAPGPGVILSRWNRA